MDNQLLTPNLDHFKEIVERFEAHVTKVKTATSPIVLSNLEREGMVLMSELQVTAPRLWNDFVTISQKRRLQIATGMADEETKWQPQQPAVISEPKPRKKTTRRKKA